LVWLQSELAAADAAHELIIVMGHHRAEDFTDGSPVSGTALTMALAASDGMVLHVTGHGHRNSADVYTPEVNGVSDHGYWELMLASTVDFPMQSRVIEIVDEDNGHISIYATNLGHNSPPGSLAHQGRMLAAGALSFGGFHGATDLVAYWDEDALVQNLLLRVPISPALRQELGRHDWPTRIESETTLRALMAPAPLPHCPP
jgi:hypothetical protein